jgi:hypothetical protein
MENTRGWSSWRPPATSPAAFGKIARFPYTAPYEDITLKGASRNRCHG